MQVLYENQIASYYINSVYYSRSPGNEYLPFFPPANRLLVQLPSHLVMHLVSTTLATMLITMWKKWYTGINIIKLGMFDT